MFDKLVRGVYTYLVIVLTFVDTVDKIKLLVADKHPVFNEGLSRLLADEDDLEVIATATDGDEAVRMAKELIPDVAIIGVDLPKLDGIQAAKQIKAACSSTAILMFSEYDYGAYVLPSLRAGALGYLVKTSLLSELISAIHAVHAGEEVVSPKAAANILHRLASHHGEETRGSEELHAREVEILKLVAKGMCNKDIASELVISDRTVQTHLANIFRKLGASSRIQAALYGLKRGWLTFDDLA